MTTGPFSPKLYWAFFRGDSMERRTDFFPLMIPSGQEDLKWNKTHFPYFVLPGGVLGQPAYPKICLCFLLVLLKLDTHLLDLCVVLQLHRSRKDTFYQLIRRLFLFLLFHLEKFFPQESSQDSCFRLLGARKNRQ